MIPWTLASAGIGAALMYFFDPERGPERRARWRDQAMRAGGELQKGGEVGASDTRNRARGLRASLQSRLAAEPVSDAVLTERVRAALGHAVSHPSAIEVTVADGRVILAGPILAQELPLLIDCVLDVRGVSDLENRLQPHADAGNVPGLQGTPAARRGSRYQQMQSNWSPNTRLTTGVIGAAASLYGLAGRGVTSKIAGAGGLALLARAATNLDFGRLTGLGARRHSVKVQKTITIDAPVEHVFSIWSNPTNFPQFMTHVREVRPLDGRDTRRWQWKVRGKSGMEFEFDTQLTAYQENRFLAWRTEPGAWIQHEGQVRFIPNDDRSTTAQVTLAYTPIAGAVGHAIAKLLGDDPKSQMDDDLMRMKTFVESGVRPRDAAAAARPGTGTPTPPGRPPLSS